MTSDPLAPPVSPLDEWPPRWAPAAVIFDCDGLLVDTEGQWIALQDQYLARHDTAIDPDTRRRLTGRSAATVMRALGEAVGKHPRMVAEELMAVHREHVDESLTPLPGALEIVRAVAAVRPVAVASNSPRDLLDAKLSGLGLIELVDASVSIEDVAEPKPAPDMYVAAARALGAEPADCLGFEDSETGADAARAAGLQLIAVPSIPGQEPRAPRRLDSLTDPVLAAWISTWEVQR